MINNYHHIELNGVKYRLAEDAEGDHYVLSGQPLRPPNTALVQGTAEGNPIFQIRPDVLSWMIDDWSGGEGQIRFDSSNANRHWRLRNVDPFSEPGVLFPGPIIRETVDVGGSAKLQKSLVLVKSGSKLFGLDTEAPTVYEWDPINKKWTTPVTNAGATLGCNNLAGADDDYIYFTETNSSNVWRYTPTPTWTKINNDTGWTMFNGGVVALGDYVYLYDPGTGRLWEIPKTGTFPVASVLVDDPSQESPQPAFGTYGAASVAVAANRIYTMLTYYAGYTVIREFTPTTARAAGYAQEIFRIPGFIGTSIWWHDGVIYLTGREDNPNRTTQLILYIQPDVSYGTLGKLRYPDEIAESVLGGPQVSRMLDHAVVSGSVSATETGSGLFLIDSVTGNICQYGYGLATIDNEYWNAPVAYRGDFFWSTNIEGVSSDKTIFWADETVRTTGLSEAITPWNDFGLLDAKTLSSFVVTLEPLPTSWSVQILYAKDGDDSSYTSAGTISTAGTSNATLQVSAGGSPVNFRNLRVKIKFAWGGGGEPTTTPKVLGVECRAQVSQKSRQYKLMLDCSDDQGGVVGLRTGVDKISNVRIAGDSNQAVTFLDGYVDRKPGVYETLDVLVDDYDIFTQKAGEATARVTLTEVLGSPAYTG